MVFTLETARSLAQALKHLNSCPFDLVLLNLMLPDIQGLQTLDEVCPFYPHIPLVVLTDPENLDMAVAALKMGASEYLVTNDSLQSRLIQTIQSTLEEKENEEELGQTETHWPSSGG